MTIQKTAAIRLEGGIGDHLLGMRLIAFIHARYPNYRLVAYSDSGGHQAQLDVAKLSPYISEVLPVLKITEGVTKRTMWHLENIEPQQLVAMQSADVFFDGALWSFLVPQARALGIPFYDILANVPELHIPEESREAAQTILTKARSTGGYVEPHFVAMNLAKYGADFLTSNYDKLRNFLNLLLEDPAVLILNIFITNPQFPHWPQPERSQRESMARKECEFLSELCDLNDRILPVVNKGITTVAALLELSAYFIGVDNGIKHLAWALRRPHSVIVPEVPNFEKVEHLQRLRSVLHWVPDFDRAISLSDGRDIENHVKEAREAYTRSRGAQRPED